MRHLTVVPGLCALLILTLGACQTPDRSPPHLAAGRGDAWHGHLSWPVGFHQGRSDLDDAREQFAFGLIDFDLQPPASPVSLALQVLGSGSNNVPDGSFVEADSTSVLQFNLGLRKYWYSGPWQPFLGGGVSFVDVSVYEEGHYYYSRDEDSASDVGGWLGAGVHYSPVGGWLVGLSVQYLTAGDVELDSGDVDASSLDVLVHFGWGW